MDGYQFWSSIVSALGWPVSALLIALLFKGRISKLLDNLLSLEFPGVKAEFAKGLRNVEEIDEVDALPKSAPQSAPGPAPGPVPEVALPPPSVTGAPVAQEGGGPVPPVVERPPSPLPSLDRPSGMYTARPPTPLDRPRGAQEALTHPTGVVMEAWKALEGMIMSTLSLRVRDLGNVDQLNVDRAIEILTERSILSPEKRASIKELQRLRNLAAQSRFEIDPEDASRFSYLAHGMKDYLRGVVRGMPG